MNISGTKTNTTVTCGNHIQRVTSVINDNPVEQVSDFKYLEYLISDYTSDSEDKIQTNSGLLEKLTVSQLVKKFPAFYGTRRFITALTTPHHLSLS
jgi:hypothetical protein